MSQHANIPAFNHRVLPWVLVAPQLAITLIFFIWPAGQAVWQSFLREDAFGLSSEFVGLENYALLFSDSGYYHTLWTTLVFSADVTLLSMGMSLLLVTVAAAWKQISYNFLFFLAGLQAIPASLHEAAAIDGAGPVRRFITITFPQLSPTSFFLLVVNVVYAFFDTFGIIHAVT